MLTFDDPYQKIVGMSRFMWIDKVLQLPCCPVLRCDEHQDSGFVTMLSTFDYKGLQIRNAEGVWKDVENRPGSLVVNIGILFSKITGGMLKATPHRVVDYGGRR